MNSQRKSETNGIKIVAVVQCAIALERCSGFHCSLAFHKRENYFNGYGQNVLYVPFSCGGCPGRRISRLLANLEKGTKRKMWADRKSIAVHFTACIVTDNGHYPKCPFKDYMKAIVSQKGFRIIEGGYESKGSAKRRQRNHYKAYALLEGTKTGSGVDMSPALPKNNVECLLECGD